MSLSIDVYDDISPAVYPSAWRIKVRLFQLGVTTMGMPAAIPDALTQAGIQVKLGNMRNAARWVALITELASIWRDRRRHPEITEATKLLHDGWRLFSDWPLRPHRIGELVYSVKLGKLFGEPSEFGDFLWNTELDARPVPLEEVYMRLSLQSDDVVNEHSWKVCFWLALLTESELLQQCWEEEKNRVA